MKKIIISFLLVFLSIFNAFGVFAEKTQYFYDGEWHDYTGSKMSLSVNGEIIKGEMPPVIFKSRSVVPAREVFERLGADVLWDAETETVTVSYEDTKIKLIINSRIAKINAQAVTMEIPAKLINGKTMIPVRFVGENLGMIVDFDENTNTVIISNSKYTENIDTENNNNNNEDLNTDEDNVDSSASEDNKTSSDSQNEENDEKIANVSFKGTQIVETKKELLINFDVENKPKYKDFTLENPERIVVDLKNCTFKSLPSDLSIEKGNVDKIRFGNQEDGARIVIDVSLNLGYSFTYKNKVFQIKLNMSSTEDKKLDVLSKTTYRKQGTLDYFESPYKITDVTHDKTKKEIIILVDLDNKKGEDASKTINSLYAKAIGFSMEDDDGKFVISLKNNDINLSKSGEKALVIKSTIKPLKKSVTLDAGHGGSDPGAVYTDANGNVLVNEKDLNLSVTLMVRDILEKKGVEVNLIREEDIYVDFLKVGSIANSIGSTLFVSIHTNSFTNTEVSGIEVYGYLSGGTVSNGMSSELLANNVLDAMLNTTKAGSRGVRDGKNLAVINSTAAPAVLVEIGFITNDAERNKMVTLGYQQKLAEGIAEGILKSFEEMEIE